eukprot:3869250-Alexandrium_andersonii.AAC.1
MQSVLPKTSAKPRAGFMRSGSWDGAMPQAGRWVARPRVQWCFSEGGWRTGGQTVAVARFTATSG